MAARPSHDCFPDTPHDPRWPLWTRGNVGEVYPNVVTPLSADLFGEGPNRAQTRMLHQLGVLTAAEAAEVPPITGHFGGYLFVNLSLARLSGVRTPGMSPAVVDQQMLGVTDGPIHEPRRSDRNLGASLRIPARAMGLLWRADVSCVAAARAATDQWTASLPDLRAASDDELLALLDTFSPRLERCFATLMSATTVSAIGRGAMERLLSRRGSDPTALVNRMLAGIGDIESAKPAHLLWLLAREVAASATLTSLFDTGLGNLADRLDALSPPDPTVTAFQQSCRQFFSEYGHRGPDEYELASPTWGQWPVAIWAILDRLRHAPSTNDPTQSAGRSADQKDASAAAMRLAPRVIRPLFRRAVRAAIVGAQARESAKDNFMRELAAMKATLTELFTRAQGRGGPPALRDYFLLRLTELPAFMSDPLSFVPGLAARALERDALQARRPPFWFAAPTDPPRWPLRADLGEAVTTGTVLTGVGVCAGHAVGRARVVLDPTDPAALEPGEILIAPFTDPAWTPLFLAAAGVIVDVGAQQSHAAIVARELGIPAVVSVTGASRTIRTGTLVELDATAGTVTIL